MLILILIFLSMVHEYAYFYEYIWKRVYYSLLWYFFLLITNVVSGCLVLTHFLAMLSLLAYICKWFSSSRPNVLA